MDPWSPVQDYEVFDDFIRKLCQQIITLCQRLTLVPIDDFNRSPHELTKFWFGLTAAQRRADRPNFSELGIKASQRGRESNTAHDYAQVYVSRCPFIKGRPAPGHIEISERCC